MYIGVIPQGDFTEKSLYKNIVGTPLAQLAKKNNRR